MRLRSAALGVGAVASVAVVVAGGAGARPLADASWTSYDHDQQATAFTDAGTFTSKVTGFELA